MLTYIERKLFKTVESRGGAAPNKKGLYNPVLPLAKHKITPSFPLSKLKPFGVSILQFFCNLPGLDLLEGEGVPAMTTQYPKFTKVMSNKK